MILNNITKGHLLEAIKEIDRDGIPNKRKSKKYDLLYNNKKYPPKLVVAIANKYATGTELNWDSFSSGTPLFNFLKEEGFIIEKKSNFTWVATHKQITHYLKTKEDSQEELIELLKSVGIDTFNDKSVRGGEHDIELEEIDPFTFFCYIYKHGAKNRLKYLQEIAKRLEIEIPSDEKGIPSAQAQKVWLFPYKYERTNNEIHRLWQFFRKELSEELSDDDFEDALKIRSVGKTKLTEALFYIKPEKYLPINGPTKPYLNELGINPTFDTYSQYIELLEQIRSKTDLPFYELSYEAWQWSKKRAKLSYWIFQGNPKAFDFETALKQEILSDWNVSAHKDKIKVGDKVVLWITGDKAGCYALAEVTQNPREVGALPDDHLWKMSNSNNLKAGIKITHNLVDTPILKASIDSKEKLKDLKVGHQGTNFSATEEEFQSILEMTKKLIGFEQKSKKSNISDMKFSLNTIFYGPPGTGKTYNTIKRAAEIIENRKIDSYEEALNIFKANLHDRIEFITFHQNYSYEDFIQGLRPETDNKSSLVFEKKDGIFMNISVNAIFEYYKKYKEFIDNKNVQSVDLNEAYLGFVEHLKKKENKEFQTSTGSLIHISGFTKNDNIELKHKEGSKTYIVSGQRLIKLYNVFPDIELINNIHNDIRDVIGGCNATVYWVALNEFITYFNTIKSSVLSDIDIEGQYDEIGYESKKKLLSTIDIGTLRTISNTDVPNYVIIIDEINRANISRVFGELITLIEPDKRFGGSIPMETKLPSGDLFAVPSNLYIIGTMNTADKSIALLDIALRRRFEFESMYPDYTISGILDVEILKKINEKIKNTKGHDFQIGHSYFMNENKDLVERMNKKVIPLLLEYYMNDEKEVKSILQSAGLAIEKDSWPIRITGKS